MKHSISAAGNLLIGLKAWFELKVKQFMCHHSWKMTVEKTVRHWDSDDSWGYDWHREWVCEKCGKVFIAETHRPIPRDARFLTEEDIREVQELEKATSK